MTTFSLASPSISAASTPAQQYSSSEEDDDDISTLPYPAELSRTAFLEPNFSPSTYLSTLRNRHQTLEDLRGDLRERSQLLNRELLDLVNGNYEEFLSLGVDLRGGEEKVEGVRVGVLGFEREVRAVKAGVAERAGEVRDLVRERKEVRRDVVFGRALLELGEKVGELERALGVVQGEEDGFDEDEDDEDDDYAEGEEASNGIPLKRLRRQADSYLLINRMIERMDPNHPFLVAQRVKLVDLRKTLLLDLAGALTKSKQAKSEALLGLLRIYTDLDAQGESLKVLK